MAGFLLGARHGRHGREHRGVEKVPAQEKQNEDDQRRAGHVRHLEHLPGVPWAGTAHLAQQGGALAQHQTARHTPDPELHQRCGADPEQLAHQQLKRLQGAGEDLDDLRGLLLDH